MYYFLVMYMNNFEFDRAFLKGSIIQSISIIILIPLLLYFFGLKGVIIGLSASIVITIIVYFYQMLRTFKIVN